MTMTRALAGALVGLGLVGCFSASDDGGDEIGDTTDTAGDTTDTTTTTTDTTTTTTDTTESTDTTDTDTTTGDDPFVFADEPLISYTRVDRMGMPAVATALITSKDAYNAANPTDDTDADFLTEITASMMGLHAALDDDLMGLGVVPCSVADCLFGQVLTTMVPDTLQIDLSATTGFPNGRRLDDPVIDMTLALILLDLSVMGQDVMLFANLPLNPPANDVPFSPNFPYLAEPN